MSDRTDKPSEQSPIAQLAELQVVQFISDALRAGQRAILVTGRGQVSMRVPEAALAACASAPARALHIGPPLPEPPELQEMIGAAVGIAGGRELTPQAMARLLLYADPRPTVILAIDHAHTLPHRSLCYLSLMTELLAADAPILQIVLAAGPALLDTLAQPEFEWLRNRLCRPGFETFQTLHRGRANAALLGPRKRAQGHASAGLAHIQHADPMAASQWDDGIARPAVYAAGAVVAMSCLAAIGYFALPAFTVGPTPPPIPSLNSAAPQRFLAPSNPSQSLAQLGPGQTDEAIDSLIDEVVDAVASGSVEMVSTLSERIEKLEASASPDGPKLVIAILKRFAARASAAATTGRVDEARRLERFYQSMLTDIPGASSARSILGPALQREIAERRGLPPSGSAVSAEQPGAAGNGDRAALSPNAAAPAPPSAAPDQNVDAARPAILAEAAPTAPDGPTALSAEQPGAGDEDRAALSPNAAAPATPSAAPDQDVDVARPAIVAEAAPTAPDGPTALSAERPGAAGDEDRAALSPNAAAPAPPSAAPDQEVDVARPASPLTETPGASGASTIGSPPQQGEIAERPGLPPSGSAISAEQPGAAGNGDRVALSPNAAAPAPPSAAPDQNVDVARPAILAKAAPTAPEGPTGPVVAGLPTLAPVRVVLNVARESVGGAGRVAEIQQALVAAGLEVADLVPVDAQRPGPSIGYFFQSDRNAAADVSHLLEPLLGAVDPVVLRMRKSIPEPGTIEIAIP